MYICANIKFYTYFLQCNLKSQSMAFCDSLTASNAGFQEWKEKKPDYNPKLCESFDKQWLKFLTIFDYCLFYLK